MRTDHIVLALFHATDTFDAVVQFGVLFMVLGISLFCIIALQIPGKYYHYPSLGH